jgi:uncharacterized protein YndB with AHSA1/START domain
LIVDARIEITRTYKHPIGAVWSAISDAAEISTWFIKADFRAEVGYEYTFTHESTTITGTVLESKPPRILVYTWVLGGVATTVRWTLHETADGTLLTLVHDGIEAYGESAATWFSNFEHGWKTCADELEKYLSNVRVDEQS